MSLKYDPNKSFHQILSSERVSDKSATFVLTNWGKKQYNKSNNLFTNQISQWHVTPHKAIYSLNFTHSHICFRKKEKKCFYFLICKKKINMLHKWLHIVRHIWDSCSTTAAGMTRVNITWIFFPVSRMMYIHYMHVWKSALSCCLRTQYVFRWVVHLHELGTRPKCPK